MVKVSKSEAARNREALTNAAERLFQERGSDGVGVVELGRAAGLSQGALYSKFGSKQALLMAAVRKAFRRKSEEALKLGETPTLETLLSLHLSRAARDEVGEGCGLVAWASEARRWDDEGQRAYTEGFTLTSDLYRAALERADDADAPQRSLAVVAAVVGALSLARSVQATDPGLSDAVLDSVGTMLRDYLGR